MDTKDNKEIAQIISILQEKEPRKPVSNPSNIQIGLKGTTASLQVNATNNIVDHLHHSDFLTNWIFQSNREDDDTDH